MVPRVPYPHNPPFRSLPRRFTWRGPHFLACSPVASQGLANLPASSEGTSASPVYYGGESRTSLYAKDTTVAYAVGSSAALPALPAMILRNIIGGNGTALSWSTDASASRVGAAVGKATQEPFTVRGIADDNLVGFYATVAGAESGDATKAAVAVSGVQLCGAKPPFAPP